MPNYIYDFYHDTRLPYTVDFVYATRWVSPSVSARIIDVKADMVSLII